MQIVMVTTIKLKPRVAKLIHNTTITNLTFIEFKILQAIFLTSYTLTK